MPGPGHCRSILVVALAGVTLAAAAAAAPGRVGAPARAPAAAPSAAKLQDDDVVARVNSVPIERKWVREVVQSTLAAGEFPADAENVARLAAEALESLIAFELLYQDSQARQVRIPDSDVDEEMKRARDGFPDDAAFERALKSKGLTVDGLRRDTRRSLAVSRLLESTVAADIRVDDSRIEASYAENRAAFEHGEQVRLRHILVRVPERAPRARKEAARLEAESLRKQLAAGSDFAALARAHSQDPASAAQGGDLGFVGRGELTEPIESQAFALVPGKPSDVIASPHGFEIIDVVERRGPGTAPLAEVRPRIAAILLKQERQRREASYVSELRRRAKIEYLAPL